MAAKRASNRSSKSEGTSPGPSLRQLSGLVGMKNGNNGELHRLLGDRIRLGVVSSLAVTDRLTFRELKDILEVSDGNLSVHARKLEEAGYIDSHKSFSERKPKTEFELTHTGREALRSYLNHMEALIRATDLR